VMKELEVIARKYLASETKKSGRAKSDRRSDRSLKTPRK
jgi:hypothetical protein